VYTETSYRSAFRPTWCPGCGNFAVLATASRAFADLQIPPEDAAVVSGIGCSSRIPYLFNTYGMHGLHGRAIPLATGLKLFRPELTVAVFGGDGDLLSIGANHLIHAARRNLDITVVLMDNQIYGLTKAQFSPTSLQGQITRSSPFGKAEPLINPVMLALTAGATFVARRFTGRPHRLHETLTQALQHKGFSFVHVISPCREWNDRTAFYREHGEDIVAEHDTSDLRKAMDLTLDMGRQYMGVFYRADKPVFDEQVRQLVPEQAPFDLQQHMSRYR
jgi:2-oxoglutarate ferredoxin oxidoreductase subunit beta